MLCNVLLLDCSPRAVVLPVLLLWGARPLAKALVDNVQRCFDCVVVGLRFGQDDLRWASAMWVGLGAKNEREEDDDSGEVVKITYQMPPEIVAGGVVELRLKQKQISKLWHR